jgi:hypothetical protein
MKGEKILMSQRQLQRFRVMGLVEVDRITLREAAGKMGLSYRQAKRIWKRVREKVYYQDRFIAKHPSTPLREPIRALPRNRSHAPDVKSYDCAYQASAQPIYDKPFV